MAGFYHILAQMLQACRKSAWNLRNDCKMPKYLSVSFHQMCETFTTFCLNPLSETIVYFAMKKWSVCKLTNADWIRKTAYQLLWKVDVDVLNSATVCVVPFAPREPVQFIISLLLHNELAPIGSKLVSKWSPADLYKRKACGGGRLLDEPKERLCRRLTVGMIMHNYIYVPVHVWFMHWNALHHTVLYKNYDSTG